MLPTHNADGSPIVPITEEQRFLFDAQGWLLIPGVLSDDECKAAREHVYALRDDPDSLPAEHRNNYGDPINKLFDHPVVVGVLNEFLGYSPAASEDSYGFRMESIFTTIRTPGEGREFSPHGGSGYFAFPGNSHTYSCLPGVRARGDQPAIPGRANSGLTRVVWELNEVEPDDGATLLLTGSHKAAFPMPESVRKNVDSPLWHRYSCPPGSVLFFTEALTHSGQPWQNADRDRCAVFTCYNTVGHKFHHGAPPEDTLATMPPLRQSLFRGVWCHDFAKGVPNNHIEDGNWAL